MLPENCPNNLQVVVKYHVPQQDEFQPLLTQSGSPTFPWNPRDVEVCWRNLEHLEADFLFLGGGDVVWVGAMSELLCHI